MFRLEMAAIGLALSNNDCVSPGDLSHILGIPKMKARQILEQLARHQPTLKYINVHIEKNDNGFLDIKTYKFHPIRLAAYVYLSLTRSEMPKHDYDY